MDIALIILGVTNLAVVLVVLQRSTHKTTGTFEQLTDEPIFNPNKGPQTFSRSDYQEYKIQMERDGKPVEPEVEVTE